MAELILSLLEARNLTASDSDEARIHGCRDLTVLKQWGQRASRVSSVAELFAPTSD